MTVRVLLICSLQAAVLFAQSQAPAPVVLGAGDQIAIHASDVEELAKASFRISSDGAVRLPLIGEVKAAGLTVSQFEQNVTKRLEHYYKNPAVTVEIVELASNTISILGAVNEAGVQQLLVEKTLLDALAAAGGVMNEAGASVRITRQIQAGDLPLPGATRDASGRFSTADIRLADLVNGREVALNIMLKPHDVITVGKSASVYVLGQVMKSGSFPVAGDAEISLLQLLSLAGGLSPAADAQHARILRNASDPASPRKEIPVNVTAILQGREQDVTLRSADVFYVPAISDNSSKQSQPVKPLGLLR